MYAQLISQCQSVETDAPVEQPIVDTIVIVDSLPSEPILRVIGELEQRLIDAGLVDVQALDSSIQVDLKYSSTDNFFGFDAYGELERAYLQPDVAQLLLKAQALLKDKDSTLTLHIFDAVRPRSVQWVLWDTLKLPLAEKVKYVSNPRNGSIHNFGAAVDLTIAGPDSLLDMGTRFDFFGPEAYPRLEWKMLAEGRLVQAQVDNRKLLRSVMYGAGFTGLTTEWWHFNSCTREQAWELYPIIE